MPDNVNPLDAEIRALEVSLLSAPRDAETVRRLAEAYARGGMLHERAMTTYRRALADAPGNELLARALQMSELARDVESLARGEAATAAGDATPSALTASADLDAAIQLLQRYLEELPHSGDLRKALGDALMVQGRLTDAAEAYRVARAAGYRPATGILDTVQAITQRVAVNGAAALYFGQLAREHGRDQLAETMLRAALAAAPADAECAGAAAEALGDILERRRSRLHSERERGAVTFELARLRLAQNDLPGVIACLNQLDIRRQTADAPREAEFVRTVARILTEMGDYRQAFDYLSRMPLDGQTKALINQISVELERRGEVDTAAFVMEFINEHDLALTEARQFKEHELAMSTELGLADWRRANGRLDSALERYLAVLRMGYPDAREIHARIDGVLAQEPSDVTPTTLAELGAYFDGAGDDERAMTCLARAIETGASCVTPVDSSDRAGQSGAAENSLVLAAARLRAIYQRQLAANPNQFELRLRSGDLYLWDGDIVNAIGEYRYAAQFPQAEYVAQRRLAAALMRNGDLRPALDCYRSLTVNIADLAALRELAGRLDEAQLYRDALKALSMIAAVHDDYADVKQLSAAIEKKLAESGPDVAADPRMSALIGDQAVGRYRYIEQIGSGGMGSVHKVFDLKHNRVVAMKVLREGLVNNSKAVERFFREARVAATLNHPNIVSISDYSINNVSGRSYIVMELVDGPSLRDRIEGRLDRGLRLSLEDIAEDLYYCAQLCDALQATHLKGIIHRDIKPDNVMVNSRGVVKITDFGIMHVEEATFTPTGALIGTPRYMSPEQVQGIKIDGRSDLYSVGIIMYELLVGSPPFVSGDIAYQQVHVQPTPPREINPLVPDAVNEVVLRALEKDRGNRPANALALKTEIESVLDGALSPQARRLRQRMAVG